MSTTIRALGTAPCGDPKVLKCVLNIVGCKLNLRAVFLQTPHRALHRGKSSITEWKLSVLAVEGTPELVGGLRDVKAESGDSVF